MRISPTGLLLLAIIALAGCSQAPVSTDPPVVQDPGTPAAEPVPPPVIDPGRGDGSAMNTCSTPRPEACTLQYLPVCATVDTGIRCVTTPCPSTVQKTYGNACSACAGLNRRKRFGGNTRIGTVQASS